MELNNEILTAIQTRRSIRKFKPEMIPAKIIDQIITAGTYAANGMGKQSAIIMLSPVVLIVLADKNWSNRVYDGSLVMGNLMLAAHSLGIGSCWIHRAKEAFETDEGMDILKQLGITEEYEGIGHCVPGYPDGPIPQAAPRKENHIFYIQ